MKCNTCNEDVECHSTLFMSKGDFYILAMYGSLHDMRRFALKKDKYNTGDICDACIDNLLDDGRAWVIEDGVW